MLIFDQLRKNDPQLRTITWGVLVGISILLVGLWYVQVITSRRYVENQKTQSFRTVRIPAVRGKILDRSGTPLAENQPSYNISLYLDELRDRFREEYARSRPLRTVTNSLPFWKRWLGFSAVTTERAKLKRDQKLTLERQCRYRVASNIVQSLSATLQQPVSLSYERFLKHYTNQLALPLVLLTNVSPDQIARFLEQPRHSPGLDLEILPLRVYPYQSTAAHVLGYLVRDNSSAVGEDAFFNYRLPDYRGLVGIEGAFDKQLRGKAGVKSVLVNSLGYRQSENIWTPAEPGRNVVLTIDLNIQQEAERALQSAQSAVNGPVRGAVVVLDPNNGDILALVSAPAYDPNRFIPRISPDDWQKMSDEKLKPERNRATQENYHPGSIFKIAIALACLEAGLDPQEIITVLPDPARPTRGCTYVGRRKIEDTVEPGAYDFRRAFIKSSNAYFITNGLKIDVGNIVKIGQVLHLGERCELPTHQEVGGSFPSLKRVKSGWSAGETANLCIGQGALDVTPLQMALMTAAIANGGKVFWPRLVDRIEPQDTLSGDSPEVFPKGRVRGELGVRQSTLEIIQEAMRADVASGPTEGTGSQAEVPGMNVCAKTGTAQVTNPRGEVIDHTTWFTSYAPYGRPRYVVLVMVESGSSGGGTCGPIVKQIYRAIQSQENKARPPAVARSN